MKLKKHPIFDWLNFCIGYECPSKSIKIIVDKKNIADSIIAKNHYSKKPTKNSFLSLIVYYQGIISGALQLGYGIRPKEKGELNADNVREFDRMWLNDDMPKFSETITISLLINFLKKVYPNIKYLISYCDTSVGNTGTIYRASNFKLIDKIKADFYILETGERVHPVSMYHRHKSRAWSLLQSIYPNIRKADGYQLKFIYNL